LRLAFREWRLADAEAQALHLDTSLAEPSAHVVRQHRELVRPHAVGYAQDQRTVLDRDGLGALGDAGADRFAPQLGVERGLCPREAVLTRPSQDGLEGLGFSQ
jgi:hypothetical protein